MKKYAFKGKEGLEIVSLKKLTTNSIQSIAEPHRVSFYQIYHFTKGTEGVLEINFEKIVLQPDSILFVPSDVVCSFSKNSIYNGVVIIFTDFFVKNNSAAQDNLLFSKLFKRFRKPTLYRLQHLPIPDLIKAMQTELDFTGTQNRQRILLNYLENIIAYAERLVASQPQNQNDRKPGQQLIVHFYDLINSHYQTQHRLPFYCDQLGVKHSELNQATTMLIGVTPKMLINQKIILEAKSLLAYSDLSIKQICYKIGLNEPSYFTTFFSRHQGCSPKEFREKYKEFDKKCKNS